MEAHGEGLGAMDGGPRGGAHGAALERLLLSWGGWVCSSSGEGSGLGHWTEEGIHKQNVQARTCTRWGRCPGVGAHLHASQHEG